MPAIYNHEQRELSTPGAGPSSGPAPKRAKTGCITCRVRKKRCDERKPECASCERLGIQCMGYSSKRPAFLRGDDNRKKIRADLKKQIMSSKTGRGRSASGEQDDLDQEAGQEYRGVFEGQFDGQAGEHHGEGQYGFGQDGSIPTGFSDSSTGFGIQDNHRGVPTAPSQGDYGLSYVGGNNGSADRATTLSQPIQPQARATWTFANTAKVDGLDDPGPAQAQSLWNLADASWTLPPVNIGHTTQDQSLALTTTTTTVVNGNGNGSGVGHDGMTDVTDSDKAFQDVWRVLFGDNSGFTPSPSPPPVGAQAQIQVFEPDPAADLTLLSVFSPSQFGAANNTHVEYLYHYLNVVLPLQYRLGSRQLTDLIGPLAMTRDNVLTSAASLAAQHLAVQRTKKPLKLSSSWKDGPDLSPVSEDNDTMVATSAHRQSIERLRFLSSDDLTSEDVIVSALFAISFHLFSGGTSREWQEVMATSQRCLSAALNGSPEITGTPQLYNFDTPWQRYKPLIAVMVWMDILGSVSQNKASRLLPTYRQLLDQRPVADTKAHLSMSTVMGCDNTTMLALAETVSLSEWKEMAQSTGCLSVSELLRRGSAIERLLIERNWREGLLSERTDDKHDTGSNGDGEGEPENQTMIRVMREVFFSAAKVFLATVINGPHPRVPEVASAVSDVTEALHRLDLTQSNDLEINRALVLPITLAGCHCETPSQQAFFRTRFQGLGDDAAAFGNSQQALQLMEEVWRKRAAADPGETVCWRKTMKDLGWDAGILLI